MNKKMVFLSVFLSSLLFSSAVLALPMFSWSQAYYSDASMTTEVGGKYADCSGKIYTWGVVTSYRGQKVVEEICPGSNN